MSVLKRPQRVAKLFKGLEAEITYVSAVELRIKLKLRSMKEGKHEKALLTMGFQ